MKVSELIEFFHINNSPHVQTSPPAVFPRSIGEFVTNPPTSWAGNITALEVYQMCRVLETKGLIFHSDGNRSGQPPENQSFFSYHNITPNWKAYGSYEYLYYGFGKVAEGFSQSVLPLEVTKNDETKDIGTIFYMNGKYLVTARHCIEDMTNFKILGPNNFDHRKIEKIYYHSNSNVDLAIMEFDPGYNSNIKKFNLGDYKLLDNVLVMGYPPIPGFDAIQISETAQIGGSIRLSTGEVTATATPYLQPTYSIIFNARAKGGNSGSPVINEYGFVIGVVTSSPLPQGTEFFGYGVATPKNFIIEMLDGEIIPQDFEATMNSITFPSNN